jgi:predicted metal-dependent hydrolase
MGLLLDQTNHVRDRIFPTPRSFRVWAPHMSDVLVRAVPVRLTRIAARGSLLVAPVLPGAGPLVRRAAIRSALRHWYRDHAKVHFGDRVSHTADLLGIARPAVRVVDQSKRWGSCDAAGIIRLNWRLIMAPMTLVDYVIAHEACHVLEHNHSRRFWRSLETIMPDYERRVRRLNALCRGVFRGMTVARKPGHRGERGISRKTIAQGMPDCLR